MGLFPNRVLPLRSSAEFRSRVKAKCHAGQIRRDRIDEYEESVGPDRDEIVHAITTEDPPRSAIARRVAASLPIKEIRVRATIRADETELLPIHLPQFPVVAQVSGVPVDGTRESLNP